MKTRKMIADVLPKPLVESFWAGGSRMDWNNKDYDKDEQAVWVSQEAVSNNNSERNIGNNQRSIISRWWKGGL